MLGATELPGERNCLQQSWTLTKCCISSKYYKNVFLEAETFIDKSDLMVTTISANNCLQQPIYRISMNFFTLDLKKLIHFRRI